MFVDFGQVRFWSGRARCLNCAIAVSVFGALGADPRLHHLVSAEVEHVWWFLGRSFWSKCGAYVSGVCAIAVSMWGTWGSDPRFHHFVFPV